MSENIKREESFEFQAEIKKLLNILSHSLYAQGGFPQGTYFKRIRRLDQDEILLPYQYGL